METIKKVLRPGGEKDDEAMYGNQENVGSLPLRLETDKQADNESHGILRQVLNPGGDKYSEQSYGTTAHPAGEEGIQRQDKGDDVSNATFTARSYPLSSGTPADPNQPLNVDSSQDRRVPEESSTSARDTSLAGAGTIIGAGTVAPGALGAQENKHQDAEVEQATYTDRSHPLGASPETQPGNLSFAGYTGNNPVIPGHVPGEFPASPSEEKDENKTGTGANVASAMGLTAVGGAAAGGAAMAATSSDDSVRADEIHKDKEPYKATESTSHPGGKGFPMESVQSDSNASRNAAFGAGAAGAAGAGGLALASDKGDSKVTPGPQATENFENSVEPKSSHPGGSGFPVESVQSDSNASRNAAFGAGAAGAAGAGGLAVASDKGDSKVTPGPQATENFENTVEPKTKEQSTEEKDDSNLGRNAAVAGGATAAAGAGAAYFASRNDQDEGSEEKKGLIDKLKAKKELSDARVEEKKMMTDQEKQAEKERQAKHKEAQHEQKEREEGMSKEEKKDEDRIKKEAWERENAARLAAYNRGELGPNDTIADRQPVKDTIEQEGGVPTEGNITSREYREGSADRKPSLIQKILHPNKTKREEQERRASSTESPKTGESVPPTGGMQTQQLGPEEQAPEGYVTLHHEGADPNAPHLVVREQ